MIPRFNETGVVHRPLPEYDDTCYWRVAANDSEGDLGAFSATWGFSVDTTPLGTPTLLMPDDN
ncbi:MAG: hypothetical protein EAX95_10255 [Candidatus Thorarchaeota archaeon]|nr:hypothetical protein [Candidatus Thorarchaeota archaeon]